MAHYTSEYPLGKHYVYTLAYPDGKVFYVGKGSGNRIDDHEREAKRGIQSYKCNVIRKIWGNGEQIVKTILSPFPTHEDAFMYEIALIFFLPDLTNKTAGGDGMTDPTDDVRQKISKAHKGRKKPPISEEHRRNLSKAQQGKIYDEEIRLKLSEMHKGKPTWNKGRKFSKEYKRKLSESHRGKPWSEKRRAAQK